MRANLLSRMLLLLDILGGVCGNERSRINNDFAIFEDDLPFNPGFDLPGRRDFLFLASLPFL